MSVEANESTFVIITLVVLGIILFLGTYLKAEVPLLQENATAARGIKYLASVPSAVVDIEKETITAGRYKYIVSVNIPSSIKINPEPEGALLAYAVVRLKDATEIAKLVGSGEASFNIVDCVGTGCLLRATLYSTVPPIESIRSYDKVDFSEGQEYCTHVFAQPGEVSSDGVFKIKLLDVSRQKDSWTDVFPTCKAKLAVQCKNAALYTTPYLEACEVDESGAPITNTKCNNAAEMCGGSVTIRIDKLDCDKATAPQVTIDSKCGTNNCRAWRVKESAVLEIYDTECLASKNLLNEYGEVYTNYMNRLPLECAILTGKEIEEDEIVCE